MKNPKKKRNSKYTKNCRPKPYLQIIHDLITKLKIQGKEIHMWEYTWFQNFG